MSSNQFDQRILELVNEERVEAGVDPLTIDSQLDQAANLHTDEMVQADYLSHQLPGEAGLGERISATGYDWTAVTQSVAAGYSTPEAVVDAWLDSPEMREYIVNPEFTHIGIGYEDAPDNNDGDFDTYWTNLIGVANNTSTPENTENQDIEPVDDSEAEPENQDIEPVDDSEGEPENQDIEPVDDSEAEPEDQDIEPVDDSGVEPEDQDIEPVDDFGGDDSYDQRILELVNQERAAAGLDSLAIDSQLDQAADLHTDEMVQADLMSHQLPGEAGLGDRVSATGFQWSRVGENVAAGYQTPEAVMDGWMNSSGHRANILNPDFTSIGIGYEEAPDDIAGDTDVYWTQVFATESSY